MDHLTGSGIPRAAATLAAHRGRLYAIGGARAGGTALNLVQIYDIARDAWRRGPGLRVAREHLASAVLGRTIFAVGGRASGRNLGAVERLDIGGGKWQRLPGLRTPRSGFGAAVVKGEIVAVGGEQLAEGDQTIRSVELYDPALRRWRRIHNMLTPRHGLGVSSRGRIVFAVEVGSAPGTLLLKRARSAARSAAAFGPGRLSAQLGPSWPSAATNADGAGLAVA